MKISLLRKYWNEEEPECVKGNAKANIPSVIFRWKLSSLAFPWTAMCLLGIFLDLGSAYLELIDTSAKAPF